MKTVYKYKLPMIGEDVFLLELPKGSEVLLVDNQYNEVTLWALVNPEEKDIETHQLLGVETGQEIEDPDDWEYLGTYINSHGTYVLHVFRLKK